MGARISSWWLGNWALAEMRGPWREKEGANRCALCLEKRRCAGFLRPEKSTAGLGCLV